LISVAGQTDIAAVGDVKKAAALLAHPLRPRIVALAREPASATELAARLRMPRQRVNYHVRQLARTGFLRRAGQVRKRNLIEQRYMATARAYVLAPEILGPLALTGHRAEDAFSAARLVALAADLQADVAHALSESAARGQRLATLSIAADIRFERAEQRAAFTEALHQAVTELIAHHTSPALLPSGAPAAGRPFKLVIGCYPAQRSSNPSTRRQGDPS
jgi:DNA-binding transcriptional ArsR family regulator